MTEVADGDLGAIRELQSALGRFLDDASSAVRQAEHAAGDVVARIEGELAARRAALARAQEALAACRRDPKADCSGLEQRARQAEEEVAAAEAALRVASRARERAAIELSRFIREATRLTGEGRRLLGTMASDLEAYLAASGGLGGVAMRATAATPRAAPAPTPSAREPHSIPGAPPGWAMVPLDTIDVSQSTVTGPESFRKSSPDDLAWAFEALHEVILPAMAQGLGDDYFAQRDRTEGRVGSRSYSDTHRGFFGTSDGICLDRRSDGRYGVTNGYHRIWVARRLGLRDVPGMVR